MANEDISSVLGKTVNYPNQYDPSILVRESRQGNREHLNFVNVPFFGYDTWNAYEVSTLLTSGLPIAGTLKIVYSAESEYIVESKSLKLYLNSFNMTQLARNRKEAIHKIERTVSSDLSKLLGSEVYVKFHSESGYEGVYGNIPDVFNEVQWMNLETQPVASKLIVNQYNVDDSILRDEVLMYGDNPHESPYAFGETMYYHSGLLKSNCKVTQQPDWGDVFIQFEPRGLQLKNNNDYWTKLRHAPSIEALLKYIVSFRDECHFHEEICETIFTDLYNIYKPESLTVTCLYARRGGIDINPTRSTSEDLIPEDLIDTHILHRKTAKQ